MDRRQALRRLAAGGAIAAGATAVVSQPAFAYTNPVVTGSPVVSINTTGVRAAQIVIGSVPLAVCPASALSRPAPTQVSLTWETFWPGGNQVMSTGTGTAVSIPANFTNWIVDDRIRVTVVYRYQCVYAGRTTQICVRWFREFRATSGGAGAVWTLLTSTGPTTVACPAGFLAAPQAASVDNASGGRTADGTPIG